jgi:hypothetical protein
MTLRQKEVVKQKNKLMGYLTNPGRFSVLVVGPPGIGKSHIIQEAVSELEKLSPEEVEAISDDFKPPIVYHRASRLNDLKDIEGWVNIFEEVEEERYLVIDHVEDLDLKAQDLLFEMISTDKEGRFGKDGDKKFKLRVIFTSSNTLEELKGDDRNERILSVRLMTRIAQLVLEMKPISSDVGSATWKRFEVVWNYMWKEDDKGNYPNLPTDTKLKDWIIENKHKLNGNYRDLEKIAINWRHWESIEDISETSRIQLLREEFERFSSPEVSEKRKNVFIMKEGEQAKEMIDNFKKQMKQWALSESQNNTTLAAKFLDVSKRTMERW